MGGRFGKAPILLLTTTGSKTGKKRTTPVLYTKDEDRIVVVASNGGRDKDPAWWTNLKRNPNAEVQLKGKKRFMTARKATDDEKAAFWPILTKMYPSYDNYQKKTTRQIPLVILETSSS